jgi:transcriptional regulator NrdR family protein
LAEDQEFENEDSTDNNYQDDFNNVSEVETTEIVQNEVNSNKHPQRKIFKSPKKPLKKNKSSDDHKLDVAWNTLQTLASTKNTKDQFDAFGQYIAEKLRQLDSETCIHVKKIINDVIFEAELGNYRSFQHQ